MPRVSVNIVTHNNAGIIDACLQAVMRQKYPDVLVTVIDNRSSDATVSRLETWQRRGVKVVSNATNEYFARAHNWGIANTDSEFVLTLNPDVLMYPDYLSQAVAAFSLSDRIGSVNGKLLLIDRESMAPEVLLSPPAAGARIDGAGLRMRRSRRPHLRGNRELACDHCLRQQYIFGIDAACGLYRRSMLEDVTIAGEVFDNDFVMYREDVDLAWRAQLFGWDSYYAPEAIAYHVRAFHVGRGRAALPATLKRHSVKNGWLLTMKNDTPQSILRDLPWILPYQVKILAGLLTVEHSSLGAIGDLLRLLPAMRWKRSLVQRRRSRSDAELRRWFE